ncbi:MAG: hypothetical protein DRN06_06315, partial [Thermoprotei archaeon]
WVEYTDTWDIDYPPVFGTFDAYLKQLTPGNTIDITVPDDDPTEITVSDLDYPAPAPTTQDIDFDNWGTTSVPDPATLGVPLLNALIMKRHVDLSVASETVDWDGDGADDTVETSGGVEVTLMASPAADTAAPIDTYGIGLVNVTGSLEILATLSTPAAGWADMYHGSFPIRGAGLVRMATLWVAPAPYDFRIDDFSLPLGGQGLANMDDDANPEVLQLEYVTGVGTPWQELLVLTLTGATWADAWDPAREPELILEQPTTATFGVTDPIAPADPGAQIVDMDIPAGFVTNDPITTSGPTIPVDAVDETINVLDALSGIWIEREVKMNFTSNNLLNATVFYAKFCVQDADMQIQHPEVGDKLVEAPVSINLKTGGDRAYYLTKNLLTTDNGGCTNEPHKYRGYLPQFSTFARFPNGTEWTSLRWYAIGFDWIPDDGDGVYEPDVDGNDIPDWFDVRGLDSFWEKFGEDVWLYDELAYLPEDARNYEDIPEGPNLRDVASPRWIGDEDVKESNYFNGNWSMMVADVEYANTLTLKDDKDYTGFDVVVKWKGGARNNYPGVEKIVDTIRVKNPYAIALLFDYEVNEDIFGQWVLPNVELANNKWLVKVHSASSIEITYDLIYDLDGDGNIGEAGEVISHTETLTDVKDVTLEIIGAYYVYMYGDDPTLGTVDLDFDPYWDYMIMNIIENTTDPWVDYANVTDIKINDAIVTLKLHDVQYDFYVYNTEDAAVGTVDVNADGSVEYTGLYDIGAYYGPMEIEVFPGQPGSGTYRVLISGYDYYWYADSYDGYIEFDDFTSPILITFPIDNMELYMEQYEDAELDTVDVSGDEISLAGRLGPNPNTGLKLNHRSFDASEWVNAIVGITALKLPISMITYIDEYYHRFDYMPLWSQNATIEAYRGFIDWDNVAGFVGTPSWDLGTLVTDFTGTAYVGPVEELGYVESFVVPLPDYDKDEGPMIPAILGNDDYEFGGYDDFALTATGIVYITANVHDIDFYVVDNLGNPAPSGDTEVRLILPNGEEVARTPAPPELADELIGSLAWSYKWFGEGHVVYFQLPGAEGPYGVRVLYHGTEVYFDRDEIDVLYKTEFIDLVVKIFKIKLIFMDCQGNLIPDLWFKYTLPNGHTDWDHTTDEGEYDFPYISGGIITIHAAWWKGVEVPLMKAMHPNGTELPLTADGELKLNIEEGIDAPIIIKIPIKDIIFYTYNFEGDYKIPRLNITLTWVGTPKP